MVPGDRDRQEHRFSAVLGFYLEWSRSVNFLLAGRGFVGAGGGTFAHRISFEVKLVGAVHEPVEAGVGEGRIPPDLDRTLWIEVCGRSNRWPIWWRVQPAFQRSHINAFWLSV